ncbi:4'-phosphopantetheinyl transferase superfamily protein [Chitinophaga sp. 212800010-3]|uniref:4'-phosphopantetheinyl transferase superfamily protein n=1 Tax=unclassified Chitinophaga TaxID=2619133 RepID=UPI002DEC8B4A|nr:4'-phosphopantetheinyl transferase superfamily protein [Chitinophaga sp. 212800010-3]
MIGNDIVDLHAAAKESNIFRRGFLGKIFLPAEQAYIAAAACPATMAWQLWSWKEAVYKIVHRQTRQRTYAPQQFSCEISGTRGSVTHQQQQYYVISTLDAGYVHTTAAVTPQLLQHLFVKIADYNGSDYTTIILPPQLEMLKDEYGIPYARCRYTNRVTPISVSHHGAYTAMVIM